MGFIGDFLAGRTHKLARDFLFSAAAIVVLCMGAISLLTAFLEDMRVASRQPVPPRIAATTAPSQTQSVMRSVLDDNVTTASIGGRTIVLDPCTGKEKN